MMRKSLHGENFRPFVIKIGYSLNSVAVEKEIANYTIGMISTKARITDDAKVWDKIPC